MNSAVGIFLESLFATLGIFSLIIMNNGLICIISFMVVGLIDLCWDW